MTTRKLVVFTDQTDLDQAPAKAHLAEHGLDAVSLELRPRVAVPDRFRDAIGLVVGYARIDAAVFDQMPGLLAVATCSTGADMVDVATASSRGVEVVPLTDVSTKEVAAHTVALALGSVRCLAEGAAVVRAGGWTADLKVVPPDLGALTLGLVGFGRIGRQVAAWLGPMFGRVLACDPLAAGAAGGAAGGPELVGLSELIEQADLISLHLPLTVATRHLLGAAEFAAMRPGVRLVNTARGELVDGDALAQALRSGQVRAYSADVAAGEPPDPADPLLGAPNTMFTPHMAYLSQASARRYELDPARNLVAALRKKGALTR